MIKFLAVQKYYNILYKVWNFSPIKLIKVLLDIISYDTPPQVIVSPAVLTTKYFCSTESMRSYVTIAHTDLELVFWL